MKSIYLLTLTRIVSLILLSCNYPLKTRRYRLGGGRSAGREKVILNIDEGTESKYFWNGPEMKLDARMGLRIRLWSFALHVLGGRF